MALASADVNAHRREQASPEGGRVARTDLTIADGVGDPQGTARARTGTIRSGTRGGEDERPTSTEPWRRRAGLGRRSKGGPGVRETSLESDARPTRASFAEDMPHRSPASDRPCVGMATGAAGAATLAIYRLALLCFSNSNAFIPTDTGVGRPSSGQSPSVSVTAMAGRGTRGRDRQGRRRPRGRRGPPSLLLRYPQDRCLRLSIGSTKGASGTDLMQRTAPPVPALLDGRQQTLSLHEPHYSQSFERDIKIRGWP